MSGSAFVVDAVRTPRGKGSERGALHGVKPVELVRQLVDALRARQPIGDDHVEDLILGCVTQTKEQGTDIAKVAAMVAGLGDRTAGATLNRFCASGLDAVRFAALQVASGQADLVLAGGVESMSRVPMFADDGPWFSDPEVAETTGFVHMGVAADLVASLAGFGRDDLDPIAIESHRRAARAHEEGRFAGSLVPITDGGAVLLDRDENVRPGTTVERLARFEAAFADVGAEGHDAVALAKYPGLSAIDHVHHVGTSPALADGAALVLIASERGLSRFGLEPRARLASFGTFCEEPVKMLTGNVPSSRLALERAGRSVADIDVFEVNESFAAVPLHFRRSLDVDPGRLNPNGGALAMGHPLGATGAILLGTALDELERIDGQTGLVSICGGAGVTVSAVLERLKT